MKKIFIGFIVGFIAALRFVAGRLVKNEATLRAFKYEAIRWFEHLLLGYNSSKTVVTRSHEYKRYCSPNEEWKTKYSRYA